MFVSMGVPCKLGVLNSENVRERGTVSLPSSRLGGGAYRTTLHNHLCVICKVETKFL